MSSGSGDSDIDAGRAVRWWPWLLLVVAVLTQVVRIADDFAESEERGFRSLVVSGWAALALLIVVPLIVLAVNGPWLRARRLVEEAAPGRSAFIARRTITTSRVVSSVLGRRVLSTVWQSYYVVAWDARGVEIWLGWRRPELALSIAFDEIESVRVERRIDTGHRAVRALVISLRELPGVEIANIIARSDPSLATASARRYEEISVQVNAGVRGRNSSPEMTDLDS